MKLLAIRIHDVKRFAGTGIAIENIPDGLSRLTAENEFGKSTIFESVRLLLQHKHTAGGAVVRAFQPQANSGSPLVEIDIESNKIRYRLTKRFLGKKIARVFNLDTGMLEADGGDADDWITRLTQSGSNSHGPSGLLWVAQGQSMSQPSDSGDILPNLLETEVGMLVGGKRARTFLKRCDDALSELVTTKTQNPAGNYKRVSADLKAAEDQLAIDLGRRVELDVILQDLERTERSLYLHREQEENDELGEKLKSARDRLSLAEQFASQMNVLLGKQALAEAQLESARLAAQEYEARCATLVSLQDQRNKSAEKAADISGRLAQAKDRLSQDQSDWSRAEERLRNEHQLDRKIRAHNASKDALTKSKALETSLARVIAIRHEFEPLKAQLANDPFTDKTIAELQKIDNEVIRTRSKLESTRPTMSLSLSAEGIKEVRVNGQARSGPETTSTISGDTEISMGALGRIKINIIDQQSLATDAETAALALRSALDTVGVNSIEQARKRAEMRSESLIRLKGFERELEQLAPNGMQALEEELTRAKALVPDNFDPQDEPQTSGCDLGELEIQEKEALAKRDTSRDAHTELQNASAHAGAVAEMAASAYETHASSLGDDQARRDRLLALKTVLAEARDEASRTKTAVDEARAQAPDLEIAKSAVVRFESAIQTAQDTKAGLSTKRAGLVSKLEAFGDDGLGEKISAAEEEIAVLRRRSDAYAQQVRALNLLRSTLSNAQSTMQAKYFKPIADELEPLLAQVIGKGDVTLGDDYGAARLKRGDLSEDILTLSGGTQEQIAVLTRLAYAKFMKKQGYPAPVFLDDALVYCDDARLDEMFTVLQYAAQDIQCIVLTCHERLFATMGGTQLKAEPWASDY